MKFKDEVLPHCSASGSTPSTPSSHSPHLTISSRITSPIIEDMTLLGSASPSVLSPTGDSATLSRQLALAATKLSQQEAEKEHWKLEYQLMQHKQLKESQVSLCLIEYLKIFII